MCWTYNSSNGVLARAGNIVSVGYSGFAAGKNNPLLENESNVGPIPRGRWKIVGEPFDSPEHGPFCLRLQSEPGTETFGRSGFLIHGDSIVHPGMASKGCIILLRAHREDIWSSGDRELTVA